MTNDYIFSFEGYKEYLGAACGAKGTRKGVRSAMAMAAPCNTGYITQVLNGDRHFSLEQAQNISKFLNHTKDEEHFFLLLLQRDRAGTLILRQYFEDQLIALQEKRLVIRERLGKTHELTQAQQSKYYSSWIYAATNVALSIPELQDRDLLAKKLGLTTEKLIDVLDFLISVGLAVEKDGKLVSGPAHIHLGADSDLITRHHANWRLQAMKAIDNFNQQNMHYSAVVSLSAKDFKEIKDKLISTVQALTITISTSREEKLCVLNLDWFEMK